MGQPTGRGHADVSRRLLTLLGSLGLMLAALVPAQASSDLTVPSDIAREIVSDKSAETYVVFLRQAPVAAYDGDVAGFPATRPERGEKIDRNSADVRAYSDYLASTQDGALDRAGVAEGDRLYSYTFAANGFAARLTELEATALRLQPEVLFVTKDEIRQLDTDNSPTFLELDAPRGPWSRFVGEDVVVGIVDTGVWPEHPSFADDGSYGPPPAGFTGTDCDFGNAAFNPGDDAFTCNNKLLAASHYAAGFVGDSTPEDALWDGSYLSARDDDGHGSHTASTAAGNSGVPADILGNDLGAISGIAPRARIAVYKACWTVNSSGDGGCASSDLTAAIDTAVADGVDVINYSIGGSSSSLLTPDAISFLFAADAGVYVATSAGNSGPGSETVGNPAVAPWVTTVGANTQDRTYEGSASSSDGWEFFGASITDGTDELSLVDAADAGDELCNVGALDPDVVGGNIVLCLRGAIARVEKSHAVFEAGGAGLILYNASDAQSQVTDNHWVPSVHINNTDGLVIKDYIANTVDPVAQINGGVFTEIPAPWMADFSSRGSNLGAPDIIKPDITAPGVNILAANSPTGALGSPGELFQMISGTSMSSPHVAGLFALLKEAHPDWSAAAVKSAIMTTADENVYKEDGVQPADPFDMGAGMIDPNGSGRLRHSPFNPGLVYDANLDNYFAFLCGATPGSINPALCDALVGAGFSTDPSDLNLASIGVGALAGSQTVTRTVTAVARGTNSYSVDVDAPAGFDVTVVPDTLTLRQGRSASYEVTITNNGGAVLGDWAFGGMKWTSGNGSFIVESPIAVRAFEIAVPPTVEGTGTDGAASIDVQFGYDGDYVPGAHGLVAPTTQDGNVVDDPANDINVALGTGVGVTFETVTVPVDTAYARFSLFDEYTDGDDDLDLYVFDGNGAFVGGSGSGTSAEQVDVVLPAAGDYTVVVHGWQTDGPDSNYTLFSWMVPLATGGSLSIDAAPAAAVLGTTGTVDISWSGLDPATKYLGAVSHSNGVDLLDITLVNVDS